MGNPSNPIIETVSSELVELDNGDLLQVTRIKDRKYRTAPYFCIGKKGSASYLDPVLRQKVYTEGLDLTSIFVQLTPTALSLFWKLVSIRDPKSNVVKLTHFDLSDSDKNRLKKVRKELLHHQLICGIKRGFLLINPKAIIPEYGFYESVELRWIQLEHEHQLTSATTINKLDNSTNEIKLSLPSAGVMESPIEFDDQPMDDSEPKLNLDKVLKLTF